MSDRPRLLPVDRMPDGLRGSARYYWHVHQVMEFPAEERRVIPPEIRDRIAAAFGDRQEEVIGPLEAIAGFLSHTFVFDNLTPEAREALREEMERSDPAGHRWYQEHMLRINSITRLLLSVRALSDFAQPVLKRVLDSPPLQERVDAIADNINFRWKKVTRSLGDMTPVEQHTLQRDMFENHIAPLVQDVFDITVLALNDYQPIPTTPEGKVSRTMQEILDTRAATLRGARGRDKPTGKAD